MILVIIIASIFYKYARDNYLNKALWTALSVLGYFVAQFIGVFVAIFINEEVTYDDAMILIISIASSFIFELILYFIMVRYANKSDIQKSSIDILDDDL